MQITKGHNMQCILIMLHINQVRKVQYLDEGYNYNCINYTKIVTIQKVRGI